MQSESRLPIILITCNSTSKKGFKDTPPPGGGTKILYCIKIADIVPYGMNPMALAATTARSTGGSDSGVGCGGIGDD